LLTLFLLSMSLWALSGCATLGIATTDEMTQLETDLRAENRRASTRIQTLEQEVAQLEELQEKMSEVESTLVRLNQFEQQTTADVDSLMTMFREATEELEAMGLNTMAEDLATAKANSRYVANSYITLLRSEYESLGAQIQELERMMREGPSAEPAAAREESTEELLPVD
jgi:uncharacterized protein involved in exopolysaccharide biosynthesis